MPAGQAAFLPPATRRYRGRRSRHGQRPHREPMVTPEPSDEQSATRKRLRVGSANLSAHRLSEESGRSGPAGLCHYAPTLPGAAVLLRESPRAIHAQTACFGRFACWQPPGWMDPARRFLISAPSPITRSRRIGKRQTGRVQPPLRRDYWQIARVRLTDRIRTSRRPPDAGHGWHQQRPRPGTAPSRPAPVAAPTAKDPHRAWPAGWPACR